VKYDKVLLVFTSPGVCVVVGWGQSVQYN